MVKVLGFDVGIKNLAYCIVEKQEDKYIIQPSHVDNWNIINLTEQNKLGYVGEFKKLVKETNYSSALPNAYIPKSNYNVIQEGYGSMQLGNAGICMIDKIILQKPNICFIDWFTPTIIYNYNDLCIYLDVIVRKLMLINCQIVFLLFDSNRYCSTNIYPLFIFSIF